MSETNQARPKKAVLLRKYIGQHIQRIPFRYRLQPPLPIEEELPEMSHDLTAIESPTDTIGSEADSATSSPIFDEIRMTINSPPVLALPGPRLKPKQKRKPISRQRSMSPIYENSVLEWTPEFEPTYCSNQKMLFEVNANMKAKLTDLLNCDTVRKDEKMRAWVQDQLMHNEAQLKRQRKRRVSPPMIIISPAEDEDDVRRDSAAIIDRAKLHR